MDQSDCSLSEFFDNHDETAAADMLLVGGAPSPDDIFSALEALEGVSEFNPMTPGAVVEESTTTTTTTAGNFNSSSKDGDGDGEEEDEDMNKIMNNSYRLVSQKSTCSSALQDQDYSDQNDDHHQLPEQISSRKRKNRHDPKSPPPPLASAATDHQELPSDGQQRISHITVERNRRKQMNEHLSVLRSLMPCFYVKRGDQASIIGGVVDYINELQQVLQSLEAKKQRKVYSEVMISSPRIISSPLISPRKPPLSPRLINLPMSPRTPQPISPYNNNNNNMVPSTSRLPCTLEPYASPNSSSSSTLTNSSSSNNSIIVDAANELVANSRSPIAEVEVKFSGANVLLKTVSPRIPGQQVKIISALEELSLEVLHVNISTIDEKMLNSFTIKIGIECQLSADELAQLIQQTFLVS